MMPVIVTQNLTNAQKDNAELNVPPFPNRAGRCGRYTLCKTEHLCKKPEQAGVNFDELSHERIVPRFNVAPTQQGLAILHEILKRVSSIKWGLLPFGAKDEKFISLQGPSPLPSA
jgi:putative SOS response-associated peptidase YedK